MACVNTDAMALDKDHRDLGEQALQALEEAGFTIRDYNLDETGPTGVVVDVTAYKYPENDD